MLTLSLNPDPRPMVSHPFFTGRLGPCIGDITRAQCNMSMVFLQGGGLSKRQIDQVPLRGFGLGWIFRRWFAPFRAKQENQPNDPNRRS